MIRRVLVSTLACVSILVSLLCLKAQDTHVDVQFIRNVLAAQYDSLQDIEAAIHVVGFNAQNKPSYKQEMLWIKKGEKEYLQMITGSPDPHGEKVKDIQAWNGERATTWVTNPTKFNDPGSGKIMREPPKLLTAAIGSRYVLTVETMSWPKFLNGNPGEIVYEHNVTGDLYCVHGSVRTTGLPAGVLAYKAWFDPKYSFMPVKWNTGEIHKDGHIELIEEYEVIEFQQVGELFFAKKLIRRTWDGGHEDVELEIKTNSGVPDSQFELHWMTGTGIWDDISGVGYYYLGEQSKQNTATAERARGPYKEATSLKVTNNVGQNRTRVEGSIKWCLISLAGILLVTSGCVVYLQRHRFKPRK